MLAHVGVQCVSLNAPSHHQQLQPVGRRSPSVVRCAAGGKRGAGSSSSNGKSGRKQDQKQQKKQQQQDGGGTTSQRSKAALMAEFRADEITLFDGVPPGREALQVVYAYPNEYTVGITSLGYQLVWAFFEMQADVAGGWAGGGGWAGPLLAASRPPRFPSWEEEVHFPAGVRDLIFQSDCFSMNCPLPAPCSDPAVHGRGGPAAAAPRPAGLLLQLGARLQQRAEVRGALLRVCLYAVCVVCVLRWVAM